MPFRISLFIAFLALFLIGCGPDFIVGHTKVVVTEGAPIPCDIADALFAIYDEIEERYDSKVAREVMKRTVYLYPRHNPPDSKYGHGDRFNGLHEEGDVHVRVLGPKIMQSAMDHEFTAHCLPMVLGKGLNAGHKEPWTSIEAEIRAEVKKKVDPIVCE